MDVSTLTQLIGSYGFPIVACGALFWYIVKEQRENRKVQDELKTAIQNNTDVMNKLCEAVLNITSHGL